MYFVGDEKEAFIVRRARLLRAAPVARGNFDKAHLKTIHAFLFEPYAGTRYRPGQFRAEVAGWCKEREEFYYRVFYSKMDAATEGRLEAALEKMNPEWLATLPKEGFVKELSNLYAELDYIHPFYEGNSRTLRELFAQCAEEAGYYFDVRELMEKSAETLYEARDKAALQKALEDTSDEKKKAEIQTALNRELKHAPSLEELFSQCCHKMNEQERENYLAGLEKTLKNENNPASREKFSEKLVSFKRLEASINGQEHRRCELKLNHSYGPGTLIVADGKVTMQLSPKLFIDIPRELLSENTCKKGDVVQIKYLRLTKDGLTICKKDNAKGKDLER